MNILLVEDEAPKRENIRLVLDQRFPDRRLIEARSVGSAIRALRTEKFELIILDMSLPTFDIKVGESGGRPQGFGGVEVLRYMDRLDVVAPVIVVTAYPAFSQGDREIDLGALEKTLAKDHPESFKSVVFYNSMFSTWREELQEAMEKALVV